MILDLLRQAGMIGMIVGDQQVFDPLQLHVFPLELVEQFGKGSWPPDVDQESGGVGSDQIVIGRTVSNIQDVHGQY